MKKYVVICMVAFLCFSEVAGVKVVKAGKKAVSKTVVEVLYFHGKQRCPTCIAIGDNSKDVIDREFSAQQKAGQVKFKEIDISTPEGEKIGDSYKVTWSSLFVNQWKNGKEMRNDLTTFGFQNARSNTAVFRTGLKNKIAELLK